LDIHFVSTRYLEDRLQIHHDLVVLAKVFGVVACPPTYSRLFQRILYCRIREGDTPAPSSTEGAGIRQSSDGGSLLLPLPHGVDLLHESASDALNNRSAQGGAGSTGQRV
jgi:hypothetical protein